MCFQLNKLLIKLDKYLILSFLAGLVPAFFIIHMIPTDFSSYYFQAISYLKYHSHAYQFIGQYCNNVLNTSLGARPPLVPFLMALSIGIFGKNLFAIYLPFLLVRVLILPLTYLTARFFLPRKYSFLAALLLIYIPKLQTYSFGTFEADVFVGFLYLAAFYFYLRSNVLENKKYAVLSAISLGLGALSKATGFTIALGFVAAIVLVNLKKFKNTNFSRNFILYIIYFLILIGPYILWTYTNHGQIYLSYTRDKSINYISANLPALMYTVPLYLGLKFPVGLKSCFMYFFLWIIFLTGIIYSLIKKYYLFTFPTITTLLIISALSTCLLGGNIPGSYEFITILGFSMIPSSIIIIIGAKVILDIIFKYIFKIKTIYFFLNLLMLVLFYKFINNYFISPYALNYVPDQYYISIFTVIKNRSALPEVYFKTKNGYRIFTGPVIHREIRNIYNNYRFDPFSPLYKYLLLSFTSFSLIVFFFDKNNKV